MTEAKKDVFNHLVDLPGFHSDSVQQKIESVYKYKDDDSEMEPLWNVEQPIAHRSIDDIAKFCEQAYLELKNGNPDKKISHEEVWERAIKLSFSYIFEISSVDKNNISIEDQVEYQKAIESLLVMYSLDIANSKPGSDMNQNIFNILHEVCDPEVVQRAVQSIEDTGLVVKNTKGEFCPVSSMLIEIDRPEMNKRKFIQVMSIIDMMREEISRNGIGQELDVSDNLTDYMDSIKLIDWEMVSLSDIDCFVDKLTDLDSKVNIINKKEKCDYISNNHILFFDTFERGVSSGALNRMYFGDGENKTKFRQQIENGSIENIYDLLGFKLILDEIYSDRGGMVSVEKYEDTAVDRILYRGKDESLFETILGKMSEEKIDDDQNSLYEYNRKVDKTFELFFNMSGLSKDLVEAFLIVTHSRFYWDSKESTPSPKCMVEKVSESLRKIKTNIKVVGSDTINELHQKLGLINIDNYRPQDLILMKNILESYERGDDLQDDKIEQIKLRDSRVIFTDAYNDYNGAFRSDSDKFRSLDGTSLFFEIGKSDSDIYRRMAMLKKIGIKPSTIVLSAHGSPGYMNFGNTQISSSRKVPLSRPYKINIPIDESSVRRLIRDYMQPVQNIESPDYQKIKIIFNSCSGDQQFSEDICSTAESIARTISDSNINVYASSTNCFVDRQGDEVVFYDSSVAKKVGDKKHAKPSTVKLNIHWNSKDGSISELIRKNIYSVSI